MPARVLPLAIVVVLVGAATAAGAQSPTAAWQVDRPASPAAAEAYASEVSAAPGDDVHFHVSTDPSARYRIELYRIGWYDGAGGKLMGCVPADCADDVQGEPRPRPAPDPETGELRAGWPVTEELVIPLDWPTGIYRARVVLTSGPEAGRSTAVPLVVRAAEGTTHAAVYVASVNTWQAYNAWGGVSAYTDPRPAVKVSFDRPYDAGLKPYLDYPLVRFLDRYGYDVAYTTDADVDAARGQLVRHRLVILPSHSEYWTKELRDGLEAARGLGVNLAFLGGNTGYWQVRYADAGRRVLELHRSASSDPSPAPRLKTVRWRDQPVDRPECTLLGNQWQGADELSDPGPHPFVVTRAALGHPWLAGTGWRAGDRIEGAVGYEWDAVAPECAGRTPPLTVLFHHEGISTPRQPGFFASTFHSTDADAVTSTAPSGATVFSAGSIDFARALDPLPEPGTRTPPDARLQRFVRNMLDALTTG
jgi:hypothetical protein